MDSVAIIGIGCRFPGDANNPRTFWQLVCNGTDAITTIPPDRFDVDALYQAEPATPGKIVTRQGGFLENIDLFDPYFFGISPREAASLDPQQRLLLEVAWEALEDAGLVIDSLAGTPTGVFIGAWTNEYERQMYATTSDIDLYVTTGGGRSSISGRLSYVFDLRGPSLTVDTACSSSLVAIHLACQSLRNQECTLALAGGVNLILSPAITIGYSRSKMLSADGRCKFGDARADGYVRSEGAGVIVLKPLAQALADGDSIYAVIRGSAVNNDGGSGGSLVAPGVEGQVRTLREAYQRAQVPPGQVQYIEAHGTGTRVGDMIEFQALGQVLSEGRVQEQPCLVGSVKTNIGHTEAASGVAGLIKVALALRHQLIPPDLHFEQPNPAIPWDELPLAIPRTLQPWPPHKGPALAGLNSFGITGTNAHLVLEEAPARVKLDSTELPADQPWLLPLSARSPEALRALVRQWVPFLRSQPASRLPDLCFTASQRRTHHPFRLALVGRTPADLASQAQSLLEQPLPTASPRSGQPAALVLVFPGQGSQWVGMGRHLLAHSPLFRHHLQRCEQALRPFVDWSLLSLLRDPAAAEQMQEIAVIQPVLFAMQVSLASLWLAWGLQPAAVVGHSMGEVAAAVVAGILSLEEGARVICRRSQLLSRLRRQGAMMLVERSQEQVEELLSWKPGSGIGLAASNSSRASVLSGPREALAALGEDCSRRGIFWRWVQVDVASHSPQVEPLKQELGEALRGLRPQEGKLPFYSTVEARRCRGEELDAAYWGRNLREPVRFAEVVRLLLAQAPAVFLEISPHPILLPSIEQEMRDSTRQGLVLSSLRRGEDEQVSLLESLATLYCQGYNPAWQEIMPPGQLVSLPAYPWQRERFWLEQADAPRFEQGRPARRPRDAPSRHPWLGSKQIMDTPALRGLHIWEMELGPQRIASLADHCLASTPLFPAAVLVELVLAAAREVLMPERGSIFSTTLSTVNLRKALFFPEGSDQTAQIVLNMQDGPAIGWQFFSRLPAAAESDAWELRATGEFSRAPGAHHPPLTCSVTEVQNRQNTQIGQAEFYQLLAHMDLRYGPAFQAVSHVWYSQGEALGQVQLPAQAAAEAQGLVLHPVLLDACLQLLLLACLGAGGDRPAMPVSLENVHLYEQHGPARWGYAHLLTGIETQPGRMRGAVQLLDEQGRPILTVEAVAIQYLEAEPVAASAKLDEFFYELRWDPADELAAPDEGAQTPDAGVSHLLFADPSGVGAGLQQQLQAFEQRSAIVFAGPSYQCLAPDRWQINPARAEDLSRLLQEVFPSRYPSCRSIIYAWGISTAQFDLTTDAFARMQQLNGEVPLNLIHAIAQINWQAAPRLWLLSAGAQPLAQEASAYATPGQALLWGLGRTLALEHPEWRCSCLDLSKVPSQEEIKALCREILAQTRAEQVALRGTRRYVARLAHSQDIQSTSAPIKRSVRAETCAYRLVSGTPGILDTLYLRATERRTPRPREVEIAVRAAGLNFLDVLSALGARPDQVDADWLGLECTGIIVAVGSEVHALRVGERVVAVAPGSFGTFVTVPEALVAPLPSQYDFADCATLPIAFMTALYALEHLAQLRSGERVLIHSATGGVGLAAIQIARQVGAEIFATAGNPQKREYLRTLGIKHIFDSRDAQFGAQIMQATGGYGVDVILNSLTGEAISAGLSILAPYGRFLEIGKKDIYQNRLVGLQPFQRNLSYMAIDLAKMLAEREQLCGRLLRTVLQRVAQGLLTPLPYRCFPLEQGVEAFHMMAGARHIGKLLLKVSEEPVEVVIPDSAPAIHADATYLLTGGYGGLGLQVAAWLAQQGARHLALLGRQAPDQQQQRAIADLERSGTVVVARQVDIANEEELALTLAELQRTLPPLRGIFHAAGILDDGLLVHQNWQRVARVLAPKVLGAWNLHLLSQSLPLDYFVLFSSVTALLGSPSQGGYTAANAFLDELAHYRRAAGLPAVSLAWGPWAQVGLAAAQRNRGERLASQGLGSLQPRQAILLLEEALRRKQTHLALMAFDAQRWLQNHPGAASSLFLVPSAQSDKPEEASASKTLHTMLLAHEPGQRLALLESRVRAQIAQVLRTPPARIGRQTPLGSLGFDSLIALELRNRLEAEFGLTLSTTLIWTYPTLAQLASYLAEQLQLPLAQTAEQSASTLSQATPGAALAQADLEKLSEAELLALLDSSLAAIDKKGKNERIIRE
jgi:phthiocerol/phenolphthiocerol synthesis type-I polyketide synthase C